MKHPLARIFAPITMIIAIAMLSATLGTAESLEDSDGGPVMTAVDDIPENDIDSLVAGEVRNNQSSAPE